MTGVYTYITSEEKKNRNEIFSKKKKGGRRIIFAFWKKKFDFRNLIKTNFRLSRFFVIFFFPFFHDILEENIKF